MKHKKIIRKFTVLLAALVIMCGFSVTADAGGGDESDDTPTPVTEETPAPETEPEETTGGYEPQPLTPDGNMSCLLYTSCSVSIRAILVGPFPARQSW